MTNAALVAPYLSGKTQAWLRALADLEDVRAAVITQDDPDRLPPDLRRRLAGVARVADCLDGAQLALGCRALAKDLGPLDHLLKQTL